MKRFKKFLEEETGNLQQIYVDMDGVLVDFEHGLQNFIGEFDSEEEMWKKIDEFDHFFLNLPPTEDTFELWNYIKRFEPSILSSAPRSVSEAKEDKVKWVRNHLENFNDIHIISSKDEKTKFAQKDGVANILIDDRQKVIKLFTESGGIGILHKNAESTINNLKQFGY